MCCIIPSLVFCNRLIQVSQKSKYSDYFFGKFFSKLKLKDDGVSTYTTPHKAVFIEKCGPGQKGFMKFLGTTMAILKSTNDVKAHEGFCFKN